MGNPQNLQKLGFKNNKEIFIIIFINMSEKIQIENKDGIKFLTDLKNNSIDLILTDPPYIISKNSGMEEFKKKLGKVKENGENLKTLSDWENYKKKNKLENDKGRNNYLKYGNVSGKKYAYKIDFGEWDKSFTMEILEEFVKLYYKKLRKGGTLIIFFDIWKITLLKEMLEKYKFKQIRLIEWIKSNPVPLNQRVNYLSNCREVAITCVKGGKPTFNSKYDKGIYNYPIPNGKHRNHPTQKHLKMFEELIKKHSNEDDIIVDTFLGGGTTALACKNTNRKFLGCEIDKKFYKLATDLVK